MTKKRRLRVAPLSEAKMATLEETLREKSDLMDRYISAVRRGDMWRERYARMKRDMEMANDHAAFVEAAKDLEAGVLRGQIEELQAFVGRCTTGLASVSARLQVMVDAEAAREDP